MSNVKFDLPLLSLFDKEPSIDRDAIYRHVENLQALTTPVTLQILPDHSASGINPLVRHGRINKLIPEIEMWASRRAGIFISLNETDLKGRQKENIKNVRAIALDFDTLPVKDFILQPTFEVKTKRGIHAYWVLKKPKRKNTIWYRFASKIIKILCEYYGADRGATNINQVLRLAGTTHNKNPFKPTLVEITKESGLTYTLEELVLYHLHVCEPLQAFVKEYGLDVNLVARRVKLTHYSVLRSHADTLPMDVGERHIKCREFIQDVWGKINKGCFLEEAGYRMTMKILGQYQKRVDMLPGNKFSMKEIESMWEWAEKRNKIQPFETTFQKSRLITFPKKQKELSILQEPPLKVAAHAFRSLIPLHRTGSVMRCVKGFLNDFIERVISHYGFYIHEMGFRLGATGGGKCGDRLEGLSLDSSLRCSERICGRKAYYKYSPEILLGMDLEVNQLRLEDVGRPLTVYGDIVKAKAFFDSLEDDRDCEKEKPERTVRRATSLQNLTLSDIRGANKRLAEYLAGLPVRVDDS